MSTSLQKEIIELEMISLSEMEIKSHLKESIEKTAFLYEVINTKDLPEENKAYLREYWKIKLEVLLRMYSAKIGNPLFFLTKREVDVVEKYSDGI